MFTEGLCLTQREADSITGDTPRVTEMYTTTMVGEKS